MLLEKAQQVRSEAAVWVLFFRHRSAFSFFVTRAGCEGVHPGVGSQPARLQLAVIVRHEVHDRPSSEYYSMSTRSLSSVVLFLEFVCFTLCVFISN
jgi:hypothetical protein